MTTTPILGHLPLPPDGNAIKPTAHNPGGQGNRHFEKHIEPPAETTVGQKARDSICPTSTATQLLDTTTAQLSHAAVDGLFGAGAKIYPQSLAVIGYLSMANGEAGDGTPAVGSLPDREAASTAREASPPGSTDTAVSSAQPLADAAAELIAGAPGHMATGGLGSLADSVDDLHAALAAEASPHWLARRLAVVEGAHGAVMYLRDFRLADGERGAVVDALLMHAKQRGLQLERVVVNGQECWRADASPLMNDRGETIHVS